MEKSDLNLVKQKATRAQIRSIPHSHFIIMSKANELLGGEDLTINDMCVNYLQKTKEEREQLIKNTKKIIKEYNDTGS
jgi:hypothetical protein